VGFQRLLVAFGALAKESIHPVRRYCCDFQRIRVRRCARLPFGQAVGPSSPGRATEICT
jgi:hypothetical protein